MKILAIDGAYRVEGTTTELAQSFMDGAKSRGAETDMVLLRNLAIGYCANCLKCYGFAGKGIAPCSIKDDMDDLIARLAEADGILFASPVHNGFVTGLMTVFWERLSWRIVRPVGPMLNSMSMRTRLDDKVRAVGSIASAGGMPERLRKYCDDGTPWLKSNAALMLHGQWIGDLYAGADLERLPASEDDWRRIFFLRRLSERQRQQARDLGVTMAEAIRAGNLKAVTIDQMLSPPLRWIMERIFALSPPYRVANSSSAP